MTQLDLTQNFPKSPRTSTRRLRVRLVPCLQLSVFLNVLCMVSGANCFVPLRGFTVGGDKEVNIPEQYQWSEKAKEVLGGLLCDANILIFACERHTGTDSIRSQKLYRIVSCTSYLTHSYSVHAPQHGMFPIFWYQGLVES